jgi:hypothetical protein
MKINRGERITPPPAATRRPKPMTIAVTQRAVSTAFEQWATERDCALVTLATRQAVPYYVALGYEEPATYLRKVLRDAATQ